MIQRIYYVGTRLSEWDSLRFGSKKQLHCTLAYSRTWFPYRAGDTPYPLVITGPFTYNNFGGQLVVCFTSPVIERRHEELLANGAQWDYPTYHPHISVPNDNCDLDKLKWIAFDYEYYRTWEQE
jgi:hypothetical protein